MGRWLLSLFRPRQNLEPALELLQAEVRMLRDENQRLKQLVREFTRL
jgi:replication fork clamp-binding protein CrfC